MSKHHPNEPKRKWTVSTTSIAEGRDGSNSQLQADCGVAAEAVTALPCPPVVAFPTLNNTLHNTNTVSVLYAPQLLQLLIGCVHVNWLLLAFNSGIRIP